MQRTLFGAALAAALVVSPSLAEAQSISPLKFGVAAGLSLPMGDDADVVSSGYHVLGTIGFQAPLVPAGLRVDLAYNKLGEKDDNGVDYSIMSGTVNGMFNLGMAPLISPYIIGGLGLYNQKIEVGGFDNSETNVGFNGGVGLRFGLSGFSTFAEARYHFIMSEDEETGAGNSSFVPISFGIMF